MNGRTKECIFFGWSISVDGSQNTSIIVIGAAPRGFLLLSKSSPGTSKSVHVS
jgi:hypothetical protein